MAIPPSFDEVSGRPVYSIDMQPTDEAGLNLVQKHRCFTKEMDDV